MLIMQQSEATAAQRRIPFYAVDATNGYTPETGLSTFTVDVSENGGARAAGLGSDPTEIDATNLPGVYYYEATAAELSTVGFLAISIKHASMRDFFAVVQIVPWDPYNNFTTETDKIQAIDDYVDTIEADLKTYLDAIETNLDGDIAAVKTDTAAILIDTDTLEADLTTEINANETKIDTAITDIATAQADLNAPNQYKADVSGIATEANATTNKNTIVTEVNANETKIDLVKADTAAVLIDTDTMEADLKTEIDANETKIDALQADITRILGLTFENAVWEFTFTGDNQTSGGIWLYDTKANATTHNKSTGLIGYYSMACSFAADKPTVMKMYKES